MRRSSTFAVVALGMSLLSSGCCFTLGGGVSHYMYADMFAPPGPSVLIWSADEEGQRFRYVVTGSWGSLTDTSVVRETGLVPDRSFERYVPEDTRAVVVMLPADQLDALRPRARLLLDHVTSMRPGVSTSITPVTDEVLERPLLTIEDAGELDASIAHARELHQARRPSSFGDLFSALAWFPGLIVVPLEPRVDGPDRGRFAVLRSVRWLNSERESEDRIVGWSGLVAAVEEVRRSTRPWIVTAWILEPPDASDEVRAQVERLMDWFGGLDGEPIAWQRAVLREELPMDADSHTLLRQVMDALGQEDAFLGPVELRLRYDPALEGPDFKGRPF